jgi:hypothetical protein
VPTGWAPAALVREATWRGAATRRVNAPPLAERRLERAARTTGSTTGAVRERARLGRRFFGEGLGTIACGAPADLVLVDYRAATEFSAHAD